MKNIVLSAAILALASTSAFAGGPTVVSGEPEVIVTAPPAAGSVGSGAIVGVVGALALICLVACGGSDSAGTTEEADAG